MNAWVWVLLGLVGLVVLLDMHERRRADRRRIDKYQRRRMIDEANRSRQELEDR